MKQNIKTFQLKKKKTSKSVTKLGFTIFLKIKKNNLVHKYTFIQI